MIQQLVWMKIKAAMPSSTECPDRLAQNKLEEIEQENKKAENDCSNLFTWASTYQNAVLSAGGRQSSTSSSRKSVLDGIMILRSSSMFRWTSLKNSRVIRSRCVLRVGEKSDLKQAPVRGLGIASNGGIVVFDKTSGEAMNIMPKSSAHVDFALSRRMMHDFAKNGKKKRRIV